MGVFSDKELRKLKKENDRRNLLQLQADVKKFTEMKNLIGGIKFYTPKQYSIRWDAKT